MEYLAPEAGDCRAVVADSAIYVGTRAKYTGWTVNQVLSLKKKFGTGMWRSMG